MVDAQHQPHLSGAHARHDEEFPQGPVQRQRHGHQFPAQPLEPGKPVDRVDEPDVPFDVRRHLDPAMPTTVRDRNEAQRPQTGDPLVKSCPKGREIGTAVAPHEAAGREQAGDEEHVDLADMVEHDVRFVDRREPSCRRPHADSIGAERQFRGPKEPPIFPSGIGRIVERMPPRHVR